MSDQAEQSGAGGDGRVRRRRRRWSEARKRLIVADEVVVRLFFRFPDGSVLESVEDDGEITDWRASAPGGFTDRDKDDAG